MKDFHEWANLLIAKITMLGLLRPGLVQSLADVERQMTMCLIYLGVDRSFFQPVEHDIGFGYVAELQRLKRHIASGEIDQNNIFETEYRETIGRALFVLNKPIDYWYTWIG